jgi:cytochrome b561
MAVGYLMLAILLAVTLNACSRWIRVAGTSLVALGLVMIVVSTVLAQFDGTFAAIPANAPRIDRLTPAILIGQAVLACIAIVFLAWSAWRQAHRPVPTPLTMLNTPSVYGRVSRYFHWVIAVLMFCLVPIGLFMAILPRDHAERAEFVAAHQSLGLTVLALVVLRILWLLVSPPPTPASDLAVWELRSSRSVHIVLYLTLLLFPISGYFVSASSDTLIDFYGFGLPSLGQPSDDVSSIADLLHSWILPALFYVAIALHAGAVLKHQFRDGRSDAVRRMLR